jgi:large subunit ribosomal protein L29
MPPRGTIEQLRDLSTQELQSRERDLAEQVFRLRFQLTSGQAEAVGRLRSARRDFARVKTLLRERELRKGDGGNQ